MPLPAFHFHGDVVAVVFFLAFGYFYAETRIRPVITPTPATTRQRWSWTIGVLTILLSAGWPVHDLAEETLFFFHMFEHTLIGYLTPVLLLRGIPRWMADRTLGHPKVARWLRPLANPVVGFFSFNILIVLVHWPPAVAWQLNNEVTHFGMHVLLFGTGFLLFLPVYSPTPIIPRMAEPMQMLYLFLNTIIPIIPSTFLVFSTNPLYPMYGNGPASWGLTFQQDQTYAGLFMKLVVGLYLLLSIAAIWFRWSGREQALDRAQHDLVDV